MCTPVSGYPPRWRTRVPQEGAIFCISSIPYLVTLVGTSLRGFYSCRWSSKVARRVARGIKRKSVRDGGSSAFAKKSRVPLLHGWPTSVPVLLEGWSDGGKHLILMIHYILKAMRIILYQSCTFALRVFFICRTFFFNSMYTCNYMLVSVVDLPFLLPT